MKTQLLKKNWAASLALGVAGFGFLAATEVKAATITIDLDPSTATASFEQINFTAAGSIDINANTQGWAIGSPGGGDVTLTQSAVFPTISPIDIPDDNIADFTFTLDQLLGSQHTLGLFRLYYTTDAAPELASAWTAFDPTSATDTGGATLTIDGAGFTDAVLVSGANPATNTYNVTASTTSDLITGFMLEAIDVNGTNATVVNGLGTGGPGRQGNGNFVLTTFAVDVNFAPVPEPASLALLAAGCLLILPRRKSRS